MDNIAYEPIADDGGSIKLDEKELQFIPAHYMHSSGNMNVYDPVAKILMSGDIGAALEGANASIYVDDVEEHIRAPLKNEVLPLAFRAIRN